MQAIWKWELRVTDIQKLMMPVGAQMLTVQFQGISLCLWASVYPGERDRQVRVIEIFGTGHNIPPAERDYIGTVQQAGGALVWHVFEQKSLSPRPASSGKPTSPNSL
jgi:hypothetical protein